MRSPYLFNLDDLSVLFLRLIQTFFAQRLLGCRSLDILHCYKPFMADHGRMARIDTCDDNLRLLSVFRWSSESEKRRFLGRLQEGCQGFVRRGFNRDLLQAGRLTSIGENGVWKCRPIWKDIRRIKD